MYKIGLLNTKTQVLFFQKHFHVSTTNNFGTDYYNVYYNVLQCIIIVYVL